MSLIKGGKINKKGVLTLLAAEPSEPFFTKRFKKPSTRINKKLEKMASSLIFYTHIELGKHSYFSNEPVNWGNKWANECNDTYVTVELTLWLTDKSKRRRSIISVKYKVIHGDINVTMSSYIKALVALKKLVIEMRNTKVIPHSFVHDGVLLEIIRGRYYTQVKSDRATPELLDALATNIKYLSKVVNEKFSELKTHENETYLNRRKRSEGSARKNDRLKAEGQ